MKTWIAFGWIFTFIGFIALILGLGQIARIYDVVNHAGVNYSSSIISTLIWSAFAPYFAGCIVFFVIGGVGFVAGRDSKSNIEVPLMNEASTISKTNAPFLGKSTITCSVCGTINDLDAVYCKKCANNFRQ